LPFFLYYRLPMPFPDTATYLWPVQDIDSGAWPSFYLRTPGYPLFWWLCRLVSHDILFVVIAQCGLSVVAAILALVTIRKYFPHLLPLTSGALAIFHSSNAHLGWDLTLLSESVFTNLMVMWAVCLLVALETRRVGFALMTSVLSACAIFVRPSSIYMIGVLVAIALFAWVRAFARAWMVALVGPLAFALAALIIYNTVLFGIVGLSAGGTWARLWSTTVYLDPDPRLPDDINVAMSAKNAALQPSDRALIYAAGRMEPFRQALERNIGAGIGQIADRVTGWPDRSGSRYLRHRPLLSRVVSVAITQHPRIYLKNMAGTFLDYFRIIGVPQPDFYTIYPPASLYYEAFIDRPFYVINLAGYYEPARPAGFAVQSRTDGRFTVTVPPHMLTNWYGHFSRWRSRIFENDFWIWMIPFGGLAALRRSWQTRGTSSEAVALLALTSVVVGNAFACAFIGHVEPRYAHPFHFVNYLVALLVPLAIWDRCHAGPRGGKVGSP